MICSQCRKDDKEELPDDMPVSELLAACKNWLCLFCRRTEVEIQADFDAAAQKEKHQSAHDWNTAPH